MEKFITHGWITRSGLFERWINELINDAAINLRVPSDAHNFSTGRASFTFFERTLLQEVRNLTHTKTIVPWVQDVICPW